MNRSSTVIIITILKMVDPLSEEARYMSMVCAQKERASNMFYLAKSVRVLT